MPVSWGEAFSAAGRVAAYSFLWYIVGSIIMGLGEAISRGLLPLPLGPLWLSVLGTLVSALGFFIVVLGTMAAVIKVLAEVIGQEVVERLRGR
ncbi:hypothetical protein DRO33_01575 [Candidatus Bathyarchaeota archaeon]|nr:MAG: hypothetical protein DRO33_01575 [Candidatus Bathyarchaeota archaeon]